MLTQIKIERRDHYNYGESFTMQLDFNGKVARISISEQGFDAIKEEFGRPVLSGQFEQNAEYTIDL